MLGYLWGLVFFVVAVIAHLVVWRIRLPMAQTSALLKIFALFLVAGLVGMTWPPPWLETFTGDLGAMPGADTLAFVMLFIPLGLSYIVTYSAIEADSPSLTVIRLLTEAGAEGLDANGLEAGFRRLSFMESRIAHLVADNLATFDGKVYRATPKALLLVRVLDIYRRLIGRRAEGG